ncbi:hypothetical protein VTJ04DRAFT_7207 [Mycothermus thermophilus]|uniref:uncharacterized protein n=1 Tax=Humicola insolens TaxID=85995 RepID=UPI00374433EC
MGWVTGGCSVTVRYYLGAGVEWVGTLEIPPPAQSHWTECHELLYTVVLTLCLLSSMALELAQKYNHDACFLGFSLT